MPRDREGGNEQVAGMVGTFDDLIAMNTFPSNLVTSVIVCVISTLSLGLYTPEPMILFVSIVYESTWNMEHIRGRIEWRILRVLLVSVPTCNHSLINHNRRV